MFIYLSLALAFVVSATASIDSKSGKPCDEYTNLVVGPPIIYQKCGGSVTMQEAETRPQFTFNAADDVSYI